MTINRAPIPTTRSQSFRAWLVQFLIRHNDLFIFTTGIIVGFTLAVVGRFLLA